MTQNRLRASCFGQSFSFDRLTQAIGNTNARRACAEHDDLLVLQTLSSHLDRAQNRSEGDSRRSLNVVVERQQLVAIALQDRPGMRSREIFPLQAGSGKLLLSLPARTDLRSRSNLDR